MLRPVLSADIVAGIQELNLRGLPIELDDLLLVVQSLPRLSILHLSGAQKLPPSVSALFSLSQGKKGFTASYASRQFLWHSAISEAVGGAKECEHV